MALKLLPKTTLAALAAIGLFLPFAAPLPGSCVRVIGMAGAAPSPSCSGDLRECLRASADMHETTFGGRYVTADDVARCMEAFQSCTSGGASRGGSTNPSNPTESGSGKGDDGKTLPQRFTIAGEGFDCAVTGKDITCTTAPEVNASGGTTTKMISGTVSGWTVTATRSDHFVGPSVNGCVSTVDYSWPEVYEFKSDGTGFLKRSPGRYDQTLSGSCSGNFSEPVEGGEGPLTWSPAG